MAYIDAMRSLAVSSMLLSAAVAGCSRSSVPAASGATAMIRDMATRYTAAWCSHDAASVAEFYTPTGSLTINAGPPAEGRAAITAAAQGFMTAFPDLTVIMDSVSVEDNDHAVYHWTLVGTNTGPGGNGHAVRISGFEQWRIGAGGQIAESRGHFDSADYQRQLAGK